MDIDTFFAESDDADFKWMVGQLIARGALICRSLPLEAYIALCRRAWADAKVDALYKRRILSDPVLSDKIGDPYCVAVADIHTETDETGTQWKVPEGYSDLAKPLGQYRAELIFVYPTGALLPEPEQAEKCVVLIALLDLLGFEAKLNAIGLDAMYSQYAELIHKTLVLSVGEDKFSTAAGMFAGQLRRGYLRLPIRYAYFSDTILMWAPLHNAFVGTFLDRCSALFCNALDVSFPLRGAVSVGEAIMHKRTNTFLGTPLVEAARLEAAQDSIGVALGVSVRQISLPPDRVIRYSPPTKPGREDLLSGLVLDWPKHWRDFQKGSPADLLKTIRVEAYAKYYDNAISFVEYSAKNNSWFLSELTDLLGPVEPAESV